MAKVFVAFLSFLADDFSRFFRLALFTLYIVNLVAFDAFLSFFDPLKSSSSEALRTVEANVRFNGADSELSFIEPLVLMFWQQKKEI